MAVSEGPDRAGAGIVSEANAASGDSRVRLLWVTQEVPDANLGGGNIRQAALIFHLSRWVDVHLVVVGRVRDDRVRTAVAGLTEVVDPGMPEPVSHLGSRLLSLWITLVRREPREVFLNRRPRRALEPVLLDEADRHDVVLVNHQGLVPLLPSSRRARWLIHLHNVSAVRSQQRRDNAPGRRRRWLFAREAEMEGRLERLAVSSYDGVVVVSDADAELLTGLDRSRARGPVWTVPNGVDAERFRATPLPTAHRVLLSASLNYPPNADGAIWFCREVLPRVQAAIPDVTFDIVGREPPAAVLALGELPGVAVHPDVPDILPWLTRCRVAVVPLRVGTGTRLKALEALAAGRPLVGTETGIEGLGLVDGTHAVVADDPEVMANAIRRLLTDDAAAERLRVAGRLLVEDRFRWEAIAQQFARELAAFVSGPSPQSGGR